jgi:hypothetical protein
MLKDDLKNKTKKKPKKITENNKKMMTKIDIREKLTKQCLKP